MEKATIKKIREGKLKEKEDQQAKWVAKLGLIIYQTVWKIVEKRVKA
jgi:hypothetical protein